MTLKELQELRDKKHPDWRERVKQARLNGQLKIYAESYEGDIAPCEDETVRFQGVYTHSKELRKRVDKDEFDLCRISKVDKQTIEKFNSAIMDVTLVFPNGEKEYNCRLYFWKEPIYEESSDIYGNYAQWQSGFYTHGLIVLKGDIEYENNAKEQFNKYRPVI